MKKSFQLIIIYNPKGFENTQLEISDHVSPVSRQVYLDLKEDFLESEHDCNILEYREQTVWIEDNVPYA
jgi:hypothetical protein